MAATISRSHSTWINLENRLFEQSLSYLPIDDLKKIKMLCRAFSSAQRFFPLLELQLDSRRFQLSQRDINTYIDILTVFKNIFDRVPKADIGSVSSQPSLNDRLHKLTQICHLAWGIFEMNNPSKRMGAITLQLEHSEKESHPRLAAISKRVIHLQIEGGPESRIMPEGFCYVTRLAIFVSSLTRLHITSCCIQQENQLMDFIHLTDLNLSATTTSSQMAEMSRRRVFNMNYNIVLDFPRLEHLDLSITDYGLANIKLPELRSLKVQQNHSLTGEDLKYLLNCSKLECLDLSDCRALENGLEHINTLPIRELKLKNSFITNLAPLNRCLQHLDLSGSVDITDFSSLKTLTELRYLDLSNTKVQNASILPIIQALVKLKFLNLKSCKMNDEVLKEIVLFYERKFKVKPVIKEIGFKFQEFYREFHYHFGEFQLVLDYRQGISIQRA